MPRALPCNVKSKGRGFFQLRFIVLACVVVTSIIIVIIIGIPGILQLPYRIGLKVNRCDACWFAGTIDVLTQLRVKLLEQWPGMVQQGTLCFIHECVSCFIYMFAECIQSIYTIGNITVGNKC